MEMLCKIDVAWELRQKKEQEFSAARNSVLDAYEQCVLQNPEEWGYQTTMYWVTKLEQLLNAVK